MATIGRFTSNPKHDLTAALAKWQAEQAALAAQVQAVAQPVQPQSIAQPVQPVPAAAVVAQPVQPDSDAVAASWRDAYAAARGPRGF